MFYVYQKMLKNMKGYIKMKLKVINFLLVLYVLLSFSFNAYALSNNENELEGIKNFFEENLEELKEEYFIKFNKELNFNEVAYVNDTYDFADEKNGYLVVFDNGYIAFGLNYEFYCMSTEDNMSSINAKKIYYFSKNLFFKNNDCFYYLNGKKYNPIIIGNSLVSSNIGYSLENEYNNDEFQINSSCTKIPILKNIFDSSDWGNYTIVSFEQGNYTDCGVIAIMNLLYSYKLSLVADYTNYSSPDVMRQTLRWLTNWQNNIVGEGLLPDGLMYGCTQYINISGVELKSISNYDNSVFGICLFSNLNIQDTAHYALKVGEAQQKYFWIFKTYWDIVVSWDRNYNEDFVTHYPISVWNLLDGYYVIDQQYRISSYQLYNNNNIIS